MMCRGEEVVIVQVIVQVGAEEVLQRFSRGAEVQQMWWCRGAGGGVQSSRRCRCSDAEVEGTRGAAETEIRYAKVQRCSVGAVDVQRCRDGGAEVFAEVVQSWCRGGAEDEEVQRCRGRVAGGSPEEQR